ncbi:glutathione S-transferase family protein [Persicimonas caeni]|uniref:Glutathione S-transferase family protein n=1 Tax=Persicimonas caeni TaxID=2292766 RepID=A0A4Y6PYA6_PERCE|nr:glutathione S-transferase family protein [Persicimonas caeni]QDG53302.1 glutathione S-transferase family protein [Persicimonas caeni]QED34524.1 glutathione S-transferase family protein [Persicimonas caeni]
MGKMIDGEWTTEWYGSDEEGHFQREDTVFHGRVDAQPESEHPVESGRYHLYVSWACPWAHRTLIARTLLGLDEHISITAVHWFMGDEGWEFRPDEDPDAHADAINGKEFLRQIYKQADDHYTGRVTVPVLWDKEKGTIVNNESREILRMFSTQFGELANGEIDLCPDELREEVDRVIDEIYEPVNNGVYSAGFADSQKAYDEAVDTLFDALAHWNEVLGEQRYLCGDQFTEADICMFTTLVRFDPVYATHFKCNRHRLLEFDNLWNYTKEIYQMPGVAETCNLRHIKNHYYQSHPTVNPKRIVAQGFEVDYDAPHDRDRF